MINAATSYVQHSRLAPTDWSRPLQILTAVCSLVFTIGTALQNFVVVNLEMLEHTMQLAGMSPAEAANAAPGFLTGFRTAGAIFIVGNALGMLALRGWTWVFWLATVVNVAQAAGVFVIPPEVFDASIDLYGLVGILPSVITDGGALILALILIASFVRFRAPWAQRRR
jgi:hypothetical protein